MIITAVSAMWEYKNVQKCNKCNNNSSVYEPWENKKMYKNVNEYVNDIINDIINVNNVPCENM